MKNSPPANSVRATTDDANTVSAVGAEGSAVVLLAVRTMSGSVAAARFVAEPFVTERFVTERFVPTCSKLEQWRAAAPDVPLPRSAGAQAAAGGGGG